MQHDLIEKNLNFSRSKLELKTVRYHKIALEFESFVTFVNVPEKKIIFWNQPQLYLILTQFFIK